MDREKGLVLFPALQWAECTRIGSTGNSIQICDGQRRLVDTFDLRKRAYIGNTSMDAEVSLLMANQALVRLKLARPFPVTSDGYIDRRLLESSSTTRLLARAPCSIRLPTGEPL
jgi:hypothetical protein